MRCFLWIVAVPVFMCCCISRSPQRPVYAGRSVELCDSSLRAGITDTLKLGTIHSGETVAQSIELRNCGSEPLIISRTQSGCACLRAEFGSAPVEPSESRNLTILFDTQGLDGYVLRRVDVYVAGYDYPLKLWLEARVR